MKAKNLDLTTTAVFIFIAITAATRVIFNFSADLSPIANFSPVGAMALFGGARFNRLWKALAFPLVMLFLSDFILQETVFRRYGNGFLYSGWYWVYGAFALMVLTGRVLLRKLTMVNCLGALLACVLIHWIVTDLGVWIGSNTYPQTMNGFLLCLENAIPYEWRFLAGTIIYGVILFGAYQWNTARLKIEYRQ